MKKHRILFIVLTFLSTIFASCEKDNNEKGANTPGSWTWFITDVFPSVELDGETENDKELIEQIENEIKAKVALWGGVFSFAPTHENSSSGQLIRIFSETKRKIISEYLFEIDGNSRYLKIIEYGVVIDTFMIPSTNNSYFFLKDFTKDYSQANNRIVSVFGVVRYTIPR